MKIHNSREASLSLRLDDMSPRQIVEALDRFVIGQERAKKALAIALRNRIRRQRLAPEMATEIQPRNIILIGSTGVGKTELARRIAHLSNSPFIKVEASKFTEVGYVGRDVESLIRDLVEVAVEMVRQEKAEQIEGKAEENAEERLLDLLQPPSATKQKGRSKKALPQKNGKSVPPTASRKRDRLRKQLRQGKLDDQIVEIEVSERFYPPFEVLPLPGEEELDLPLKDFLAGVLTPRTIVRKMKVVEAMDYLVSEEEARLIDLDQVTREAIDRVEQTGIVFIDELDKIAGRETGHGPDVSREGVQRDILPIVEGTTVSTRYGMVHTEHILFIAAGAFHVNKPSDLIPELQGRFPVRIEMDHLTERDFVRILEEPENSLIKQYKALLSSEGIELEFTKDAVQEIAHYAWLVNESTENIGARRLHTVMEALLEDISFQGPDLKKKKILIDAGYVRSQLAGIVKDADLSRYIL
ncbi:MAG TPA: ATP-dependent protease ATPase subunit HslU [Acidobacteriota bacterium]|nr:ATP-dependent protease ATPase subunit HslU [Acidobacteriota bacterium]